MLWELAFPMNLPRSTASPSAAGSSAPLLGKSGRKKCCNTLTEHRALITCSQAEINCQLLHHSTVPILRGSFCPSISATNVKTLLRTPRRAESTNSSFESILLTGRKKDTVLFAMAVSFSHPTEHWTVALITVLSQYCANFVSPLNLDCYQATLKCCYAPQGQSSRCLPKNGCSTGPPKAPRETVYIELLWYQGTSPSDETFLAS